MTSAIDHIYELHTNPFIFSNAMLSFFEALGEKEHAVLLSYLVLPIALDGEARTFLKRANSTSNLRTFVSKVDRLRALPERVENYRACTNATLRYLFSLRAIQLSVDCIVVSRNATLPDEASPDGLVKAANTLGRFFKEYPVPAVYRMIGVMEL